ncbi:hypothetical protein L6164_012487 [Bauhinia variegata]|uniref:Uncharacterized protein n=1 Tax=Bauhinia variegata TaxID=167791 RepID=A0ACB9PAI7_BAUVA|nr:hypothetical protein L6164_012487 [Bauhinia variegata]
MAAAPAVAPPFPPPKLVHFLLIFTFLTATVAAQGGSSWCVARSDASSQALQTALDYACSAGADCILIQSNGLCYLPNTIQAHASYAFNSYYQRRSRAPGSCDFAGTATIAQTDPSYGSCVYPSSASTAGGTNTPTTTPPTNSNMPTTPTPPTSNFGGTGAGTGTGTGGITPGLNPPFTDSSRASSGTISASFLVFFSFLLILSLTF